MERPPFRQLKFSTNFQLPHEKMTMVSVKLIPGGKTGDFPEGALLLDALLEMGAIIKTPCGGKGICGKCQTRVEGALSNKTAAEKKAVGDKNNIRLACQAKLAGDVKTFIDETRFSVQRTYPLIFPDERCAIAVDVGTTSVSLALVSLSQGAVFKLGTFLNPQRRFGHDVISRIAAANDIEARKTMTRLIRQAIFTEIDRALKAMNLSERSVEKIVFSGNTTMLYLLFGLDVSPLGRHPFKTERLEFTDIAPADIDAGVFSHARISAIPMVSAFLGGDLLGGLTLCHEKGYRENTFFIDLGTNGEMFLINRSGAIYAASCAMGPALEGMNISYGMTADDGAITHVRIDSKTLAYSMIGEGPPVGLTGTALIDLAALFLSEGLIMPTGAFAADLNQQQLPAPARYKDGLTSKKIFLWNDIAVSQKDIRNLQLTKAASLTASHFILRESGCLTDDVHHVLIAGAFGSHLELDNFRRLGFIPEFSRAAWHYLGNTSLQAAANACTDDQFLQKAIQLRNRVTELELTADPAFNKKFISALNF